MKKNIFLIMLCAFTTMLLYSLVFRRGQKYCLIIIVISIIGIIVSLLLLYFTRREL